MNRLLTAFFFNIGIFLVFFSCGTSPISQQAVPVDEIEPTLISVNVLDNSSKMLFSDFAQGIKYIPLEECEDGIISHVDKVEISNSGDFLIFDRNLRKIVRFDSLGHFLNQIGEIGHGPGELVRPINFTYNPYTDHVFVNDNGNLTLVEYALDGKLVRKQHPVPFEAREIGLIDENHYCFYSDFLDSKTGFNYHITDTDFHCLGAFEAFQSMNEYGGIDDDVFMKIGNNLLYKSPLSNILYQVTATAITPLYHIECNVNGKWLSGNNVNQLREMFYHETDASYCWRTFMTEQYLIIFIIDSAKDGYNQVNLAVYDRKSGKLFSGNPYLNDLVPHYNASTNIHAVYDNKLIAICFAEEFQQNIESLQSDIDLYAKIRRPLLSKDTLSSLIERFTPYAQKTNAVIQVVQLKSE